MSHIIWKGHVTFGMVSIPVALHPGEKANDLSFSLLDKRDRAPIGYRKINKNTGEEVPASAIVKGFEYAKGEFVLLAPEDLENANPKATQTIDIVDFVEISEIPPQMFDRPYWLTPQAKGEKPYRLLSATLEESGKVGIATVVLSHRQHLACVLSRDSALVLELLRFDSELTSPQSADIDLKELQKIKLSEREKALARKLLTEMTSKFRPDAYRDEYRDQLRTWLEAKARSKSRGARGKRAAPVTPVKTGRVINLMDVLKQSLDRRAAPTSQKPRGIRGRKGA